MSSLIESPEEPGEAEVTTPRIDWDDMGRPRWVHRCGNSTSDSLLPLGPDRWEASIVMNTITPSLYCPLCRTHGFWVNGAWLLA